MAEPVDRPSSQLFVSYARSSDASVRALVEELRAAGSMAWVDVDAIEKTADWWDEIQAGIRQADAFVVVLTPAYVASPVCRDELEYARGNGKKLIPVLLEPLDDAAESPEWLASVRALNWFDLTAGGGQVADVAAEIVRVAALDHEWTQEHSRLLGLATTWHSEGRPTSRLLRGRTVTAAERELAVERPTDQPQPSELQRAFVMASRRHRGRTRSAFTVVAALVTAVAVALAAVAIARGREAERQRNEAVRQEDLALAAADEADAARSDAEQRLAESDFERFTAAARSAPTLREAASFALAARAAAAQGSIDDGRELDELWRVALDTSRPVAEFGALVEPQAGSGGDQGVAVSGDGSTLAVTSALGEVTVVDLWTLEPRQTIARPFDGLDVGQVGLSFDGTQLVRARSRYEDDEAASRVTLRVQWFDLTVDPAQETGSVDLPADSPPMAVGFGPDDEMAVVVEEDGFVWLAVPGRPPDEATRLGSAVARANADYVTAAFSADGNRACLGGTTKALFQIAPPIVIAPAVAERQVAGRCLAEPCRGDVRNRMIIVDGAVDCVDAEHRTIDELGTCGSCVETRGLGSEPTRELARGSPVASAFEFGRGYAVPGPMGPWIVLVPPSGVVGVWLDEPTGELPAEDADDAAGSDVQPADIQQGEDGTVVVESVEGERVEVRPEIDLFAETTAGPVVVEGSRLVGVDTDSGELLVVDIASGAGRRVDLPGVEPAADGVTFGDGIAAIASNDDIAMVDLADESVTAVLDDDMGGRRPCGGAFSQNGAYLVVARCDDTGADIEMGVVTTTDGTISMSPTELPIDLPFGGRLTLSVDDRGAVAAAANPQGNIAVRRGDAYIQPSELLIDPQQSNSYATGWVGVDTSGSWVVTQRHLEGVKLWRVSDTTLEQVAGLALAPVGEWYEVLDPPTSVRFTPSMLALAWPTELFDRPAAWRLDPGVAVGGVCAHWSAATHDRLAVLGIDRYDVGCVAETDAPPARSPRPEATVADLTERVLTWRLDGTETFELSDDFRPQAVDTGVDGAVWVAGYGVASISPGGSTTYASIFPVTTFDSVVVVDSDEVWFGGTFDLGFVRPDFGVEEFSTLTKGDIAAVDGLVWAVESSAQTTTLYGFDTTGLAEEIPLAGDFDGYAPVAVVPEPGDLMAVVFTRSDPDAPPSTLIADVKPDRSVSMIEWDGVDATNMLVDSRGNVWVTLSDRDGVTSIDLEGFDELHAATVGAITALETDGDDNVWFTTSHQVGVVDRNGEITAWPLDGAELLADIAWNPFDGSIWVVDASAGLVTKVLVHESDPSAGAG